LSFDVKGTFILSRNDESSEIFLSSPISGNHHYQLENEKFISKTNKNDELLATMKKEIDTLFSCDIDFENLEKKYIKKVEEIKKEIYQLQNLRPELASFQMEGSLEGVSKTFMDQYL
jgi:molecular chaperone GrpE (heat shock protein)